MTLLLSAVLLFQMNPDQARFEGAKRLRDEGRCGEALSELTPLAAKYPRSASIAFLLGQCLFETGKYEEAAGAFGTALLSQPRSAQVRYFLGSALGMSGRFPEGIEQLQIATRLDPEFAPAFRVLGMFRVQRGQLTPETRAALERALALEPEDARSLYWVGRYHLDLREYEQARVPLEKAAKLDVRSVQTRLALGQALSNTGEIDRALAEFTFVLQKQPGGFEALIGRARCLFRKQEFDAALADADAALKAAGQPEDKRAAWWLLSRIHRLSGHDAEADRAERERMLLEQQLDARMARFRELQESAMRLRAAGESAKVIQVLEEALAIEQRQDSLVLLGDCYVETGRLAEAESAYLRAQQSGPASEDVAARLRKVRERLAAMR